MFRYLLFPKIKRQRISYPLSRYHGYGYGETRPPQASSDNFWGIFLTNLLLFRLMLHLGVYDDVIKDAKEWWKKDQEPPERP